MAKFRKSFSNKLINNQSANQPLKPTDLTGQMQTAVRSTSKLNAINDFKKLSDGDFPLLKGIQFGSPSSVGRKSSSSTGAGSEWTSLVKTASGGVASLIGGGFLESGIDSLISGLTNWLGGGGNSETPLVRFALPDPQQKAMYVASGALLASSNFAGVSQNTPLQGPVYKQTDITQAVKNALLTSSILNDVIAEI